MTNAGDALNVEFLLHEARSAVVELGEEWDDRLGTILEFCAEDPAERFPGRKPPTGRRMVNYVARYFAERRRKFMVKEVNTVPDPAVDEVLRAFLRVPDSELKLYEKAHRESMAAENTIGQLLESYIASGLERADWVWCCGATVRATDFIKRTEVGWLALQVKNRDNSENSSSSAVREGTFISKWHRISSRNGKTFWSELPDNDGSLSERGFFEHIHKLAGFVGGID